LIRQEDKRRPTPRPKDISMIIVLSVRLRAILPKIAVKEKPSQNWPKNLPKTFVSIAERKATACINVPFPEARPLLSPLASTARKRDIYLEIAPITNKVFTTRVVHASNVAQRDIWPRNAPTDLAKSVTPLPTKTTNKVETKITITKMKDKVTKKTMPMKMIFSVMVMHNLI